MIRVIASGALVKYDASALINGVAELFHPVGKKAGSPFVP
jgi:hypothetical protein